MDASPWRGRSSGVILVGMARVGSICGMAAMLVLVAVAPSAMATSDTPRASIRLGGSWVDPDERYGWSLFTKRPGPPEGTGPHGDQRPCLSLAAYERAGRELQIRESTLCYGIPHYLHATSEPLLISNPVLLNKDQPVTALGIAAASAAKTLKITLSGNVRTVKLRRLNRTQARRTGLRPFSYKGFVVRGNLCLEQITLLNKAGRTLWDSGSEACSSD
jgi:hypothetical protein